MIKVLRITHFYPKRSSPALHEVSFEVKPGQIFGLLGPNGAGKTTLIRILSTLIIPTSGTANICGYDITGQEERVRNNIGVVLGDERTFYFRLTGYQNLEFFGGILGLKRASLRERIEEKLKLVGLEDAHKVPFMKFSTGMKKKLSLARALLMDPSVYLLDEPNSGIDPVSALRIREIIFDQKKKGKIILLTTHNMDEAERMSDLIGILNKGVLVTIDTPASLRKSLERRRLTVEFKKEELSSPSKIETLIERLKNVSQISEISLDNFYLSMNIGKLLEINEVLGILSESGIKIVGTKVEEARLEDVFMKMTDSN